MPAPGVTASGTMGGAPGPAAGGYTNPFWTSSNWYCEKNINGILINTLGASAIPFFLNINPGQFLRRVRFIVRSISGVGGTPTLDNPWNVFQTIDLENTDGAEIIYSQAGFNHYLYSRYGRPWEVDPARRYDFAQSINPSFTLCLAPEIRHTAGVLSNTDSRSQYRVTGNFAPTATVISSNTTPPQVTATTFMDAWAQPDPSDLMGHANEPLPPGLNIQTKKRHTGGLTLNAAGANNIFQANAVTGNQIRLAMLVVRDSNNARQDFLSDPIRWRLDNRTLGTYSPDEVFNWMQDFYGAEEIYASARPTGVYVFPRFYNAGSMVGMGWLQTNNASNLTWETTTVATATNVPGTTDILVDEVIPAGPIPVELDHI
jgi:hypothetical protein